LDALAGAGALRSTASDMMRYARAQLGDGPPDLTRAMDSTHRETYSGWKVKMVRYRLLPWQQRVARDWFLGKLHGHQYLQHGGDTGGFGAYLIFSPEKHTAVVVLSNTAIPVPSQGNEILKWIVTR
jgi:CubicO group peptidase (beta-lactamase class C family)